MADDVIRNPTGTPLFALMRQLIESTMAGTGVDPRKGGYAFVMTPSVASAFSAAVVAMRGSRLITPAGAPGAWSPPDGVRARVLGWVEGIVVLERVGEDRPRQGRPHGMCELVPIEELRAADASTVS
jgi:hypothetical protein